MLEDAEEKQNKPEEIDPFAGKWYEPIFREIFALEEDFGNEFPSEKENADDEEFVSWAETCLLNGVMTFGEVHGIEPVAEIDARRLGKILGAKFSFYSTQSENHPFWKAFSEAQIAELERKIEVPGFIKWAIRFTAPFAEKWTPELREIVKRATDIVTARGMIEVVDFYQGFSRGLQYMVELRKKLKANTKKRDKDYHKRMAVYSFAVLRGDEIEKRKDELSWPEISEMFNKEYDYKIEVEEDTLKKILQRAGLSGVGKAGRPPNIAENTE